MVVEGFANSSAQQKTLCFLHAHIHKMNNTKNINRDETDPINTLVPMDCGGGGGGGPGG